MKMCDYERKLINRDRILPNPRCKWCKCLLIDSVAGWKLCQSRGRERIYIDRGDDQAVNFIRSSTDEIRRCPTGMMYGGR